MASSSRVIKDLFEFGRTLYLRYDGAPLLHIQAAACDLEVLLSLIQSPSDARVKLLANDNPDICFETYGALELAGRLKVDSFEQDIISRISKDWPETLEEVDARRSFYASRNQEKEEEQRFPEPASVLRLARRLAPSLLSPLVFFELSNRDDLVQFGEKDPFELTGLGARWNIVDGDDRYRAAIGRRKLIFWLDNELKNAITVVQCSAQVPVDSCLTSQQHRIYEVRIAIHRGYRADPLQILLLALNGDLNVDVERFKRDACPECDDKWITKMIDIRQRLFEQMPAFYSIV